MILSGLNVLVSVAIFGWLAYYVLCKREQFTRLGRYGASITAAGILMAGATLAQDNSPFNGWSSLLFRIGVFLVLWDWLGHRRG